MREIDPQKQEIRETRPLKDKLAVITGTSRGIGREIALHLAQAGANIVGSHVTPGLHSQHRQEMVDEQASAYGVFSYSVLTDITEPAGRADLLDGASFWAQATGGEGIDYLILNAAGGLEKDKLEGWAEKINIEAQLALVDLFLPHMNYGGKIIYVTSLWAHKYDKLPHPDFYDNVARTKYEAEVALRERIPEMNEYEVRLGILCGHVIKGTAVAHKLLSNPVYKEHLEKTVESGVFPEASEMGRGALEMLLSNFDSGYTHYVGGTRAEPLN